MRLIGYTNYIDLHDTLVDGNTERLYRLITATAHECNTSKEYKLRTNFEIGDMRRCFSHPLLFYFQELCGASKKEAEYAVGVFLSLQKDDTYKDIVRVPQSYETLRAIQDEGGINHVISGANRLLIKEFLEARNVNLDHGLVSKYDGIALCFQTQKVDPIKYKAKLILRDIEASRKTVPVTFATMTGDSRADVLAGNAMKKLVEIPFRSVYFNRDGDKLPEADVSIKSLSELVEYVFEFKKDICL